MNSLQVIPKREFTYNVIQLTSTKNWKN